MNLVPSQVDDDTTDIQDVNDAMREIIEEETRQHNDSIETMRRTLGEEGEPSPRANEPDSEGTSQSESAQNTDEGKKPGIDVLLRDVENQFGREHADVIRGLQRGYNDTREAYRDAQSEMRERVAELEGAFSERERLSPTQEPEVALDPNDPINQMTPDQRELFQRLFDQQAESQGMVRRDQMEAEKTESDSKAFVDQDVNKGIDEWGDRFGSRDADGKFLFAEEAQGKTGEVFDRIYDPKRGLSATDLYVLANWQTLLDDARGQQVETRQAEDGRVERNRAARQAITENRPRSTGRTRDNGIYRKGEPLSDTIARAMAASYRELPELTR